MTKPLVTGWQPISKFLGVSLRTTMKYYYEFGLPVLRLPGGKPVLFEELFKQWLLELPENLKVKKMAEQTGEKSIKRIFGPK